MSEPDLWRFCGGLYRLLGMSRRWAAYIASASSSSLRPRLRIIMTSSPLRWLWCSSSFLCDHPCSLIQLFFELSWMTDCSWFVVSFDRFVGMTSYSSSIVNRPVEEITLLAFLFISRYRSLISSSWITKEFKRTIVSHHWDRRISLLTSLWSFFLNYYVYDYIELCMHKEFNYITESFQFF